MRRSSLLSVAVALLGVALLAGCNGAHGGYSGTATLSGGTFQPAPQPPVNPTLVIQVTNGTSATIQVTATTPEQVATVGPIAPGQVQAFDLGELPTYAILTATPLTTDAWGEVPSLASITVSNGADYDSTNPFVGVEWDDASTYSNDDYSYYTNDNTDTSTDWSNTDWSSTDTSTDTSYDTTSYDTNTDTSSDTTDDSCSDGSCSNESVAPGVSASRKPSHESLHRVNRSHKAQLVFPVLSSPNAATPTSTAGPA